MHVPNDTLLPFGPISPRNPGNPGLPFGPKEYIFMVS